MNKKTASINQFNDPINAVIKIYRKNLLVSYLRI